MKNILVVEDNVFIRDNTVELLELNEFNVLSAANGQEGLELVEKNELDVILCDIHMPQMTGYELFNRVKDNNETKDIAFIFMSASVQYKEKAEALQMGIDGYLEKPFAMETLISTINEILDKK